MPFYVVRSLLLSGSCLAVPTYAGGDGIATGAATNNFDLAGDQPAIELNRGEIVPATHGPRVQFTWQSVLTRPINTPKLSDRPSHSARPFSDATGMRLAPGVKVIPLAPAPPLAATFLALDDNNTSIPPGTMGAAGPDHLMVTLNTQLRIQTKAGATLVTSTVNNFLGALCTPGGCFDPHVAYDPFAGRWILIAEANAASPSAAIVMGVSVTTDPTGSWYLYNFPADITGTNFASSPLIGFNKDWIVLTSNLFNVSNSSFAGTHIDVLNKANYYSGAGSGFTRFTTTVAQNDISVQPAVTYDNTLPTEYLLEVWNGATAQERLLTITGPVGGETLSRGPLITIPQGVWADTTAVSNGGFAPQPGTTVKIDTQDTRMRSAVYRNGALWGTHTVFLPSATPTRAAVQWFEIDPVTQVVLQSGRVDDATGAEFFAYPSLAVNKNSDMLLGYSHFSAIEFARANFTMRFAWDALSSLRNDTGYKSGLGCYNKTFSGLLNRWGDHSQSVVDPIDDTTMWTIQEFAASPIGSCSTPNSGRSSTWWAKLTVDCASKPNGTECNDGNQCSLGPKTCQSGTCIAATPCDEVFKNGFEPPGP